MLKVLVVVLVVCVVETLDSCLEEENGFVTLLMGVVDSLFGNIKCFFVVNFTAFSTSYTF